MQTTTDLIRPGEDTDLDRKAWAAYATVSGSKADHNRDCGHYCVCGMMLMHYETSANGGWLVAAFKSSATRIYRRVNFYMSAPSPPDSWVPPRWCPEADFFAQYIFAREAEAFGMESSGCWKVVELLRDRCERMGSDMVGLRLSCEKHDAERKKSKTSEYPQAVAR